MDSFQNSVVSPLLLTLYAALFLHIVRLTLTTLFNYSRGYYSNPVMQTIQPYLKNINRVFESVLGGRASEIQFEFTHILLMAVVLSLMMVVSAIQENTGMLKKLNKNSNKKSTKKD